MTPSDLLTPTGIPVTRTAAWWSDMTIDCAEAVDEAALPIDDAHAIYEALDRIDNACDGRGPDDAVTVIFTDREHALLSEGDWLAEDRSDSVRSCRVCSCTDEDCSGCVERTGVPCHWVEADLCSACVGVPS